MPNVSTLATAQVGQHTIEVQLAGDQVIITWPAQFTVLTPARFPEVAATLTRLFANASTELARMNAGRRQP